MQRVIECFSKETEELIRVYKLPDSIKIKMLQEIFLEDGDDDYNLIFCYSLNECHAFDLQKYINIDFNFREFDYALSYIEAQVFK